MTSLTRVRTCVISSGISTPKRSNQLLNGHRHALEAVDLGLVEVARRKRPLADKPDRAALAVHDR
jgi:hypothetical protein